MYSNDKGTYEGLTKGKLSFPTIHNIDADPTNRTLIHILKQNTTDIEVKHYAVRYIEEMGSFQYARELFRVLIGRAKRAVQEIDQGRGYLEGIHIIIDHLKVNSKCFANRTIGPKGGLRR